MKYIFKSISALAVVAFFFAGCQKVGPLPFYPDGKAPVLSSSTTTIAPPPADSLKPAVVFSWTNPDYATDSGTVKYVIEIDSAGKKFVQPATFTVVGNRSDTIIARELNTILLNWGFQFGVAYKVDVRLLSSYNNNNEQYASNTITLNVTPYLIPPKVQPPATNELFLVGNATDGGWNNPVPLPMQQFAEIDSVTYGGVFHLNAGGQYLILPKNGDWSQKYAVPDGNVSGLAAGGSFSFYTSGGSNIPGPDSTGLYKIVLDFQHGKFTVTPFKNMLPDNLYITGDAFTDAWANPVGSAQTFTRLNSCEFELTTPLIGGKSYLLLPVNGDWSKKFSVNDATVPGLSAGGSFGFNLSSNIPAPATSGTYKIIANFLNYTFSVTTE